MSLDDMATIQADARSALGARARPAVCVTLARARMAEAATPGTHPDLTADVTSTRYQAARHPAGSTICSCSGATDRYDTPPGVSLDDGSLVAGPDGDRRQPGDARLQRLADAMRCAVLGDELTAIGQDPPPFGYHDRLLTYLMTATPTSLATYDATVGDSVLFDDLTTPSVVETRDERR